MMSAPKTQRAQAHRISADEYELESSSNHEDGRPLLSPENGSSDRPRDEIDPWAVACLLLQHVSR